MSDFKYNGEFTLEETHIIVEALRQYCVDNLGYVDAHKLCDRVLVFYNALKQLEKEARQEKP